MVSAEFTLYSFLVFLFLENIFQLYLTKRQVNVEHAKTRHIDILAVLIENTIMQIFQIKVYKESKDVPAELKSVLQVETFEKSRNYGLDKAQYSVFKMWLLGFVVSPLELYFGFIAYLWYNSVTITSNLGLNADNELIVSCVFMVVSSLVSLVKDMPLSLYSTFVLEEKHGFNKQTLPFFIKDQIKQFVVGQAISIPIVAAIIYIVQIGGDYFFLWLWAFVGVISLVLVVVYPVYIAPLFDKFRPLEEGHLRSSIEELAASLSFPLGQLFVVEGSKRSAHSNAYFTGLFGMKRIVLFDTLLVNKGLKDTTDLKEEEKGKGCEDDEVLAVLAHELGHWKLGHITKNIVIMQVQMGLIFLVFSMLFKYQPLYAALGFTDGSQPILIGMFVIMTYILAPYHAILSFLMAILSRRFEYQADEFAKSLGFHKELGKALVKLHIDNLGFPVYDWLYSTFSHSHPTLLQRLHRLNDSDSKKTK
jgi:STE24 endopeptidase